MPRKLIPESIYAKLFLIITLFESIADVALETAIIVKTDLVQGIFSTEQRTPLAIQLGLFILAHLVQVAYAWDALTARNTIQILGLCVFNAAFLIYAILQLSEVRTIEERADEDSLKKVLTIIPIVIVASQVAFMYLTWHLYREFGWDVYKQIGADRRIKKMYLWYQIFICLLKFDFFFFFAFCLELVLLVPSVIGAEKYLTIIAVPVTLFLLVLGYVGVRREKVWAIATFLGGCFIGSGYFVYKLVKILQGKSDISTYANVYKSLSVFSVLCLLLATASIIVGAKCWNNFDRGLKLQMNKKASSRKEKESNDGFGMHYKISSANASRMSID